MARLDGAAQVEITSPDGLLRWLAAHHGQAEAVWLVRYKKDAGARHVPRACILEGLIAWGWIDSLPRSLDSERSMLLIAPRKAKSAWSAVNKKIAARLIAEGRMAAPGLAAVTLAKTSGTWAALDAVEALAIPDDLARAFAKSRTARKNFDAFPRSVKRAILEWIGSAKKQETRAARIAETVAKAKENIRANQWRP